MTIQIVPSSEAANEVPCDALLIGAVSSDGAPQLDEAASAVDAALGGTLSEHLRRSNYKAKVGEITLVPTLGRLPAQTVAVVGLGPRGEVDPQVLRRAAGSACRRVAEWTNLATTLASSRSDEEVAAAAEGFLLGPYRFTRYKSDPRPAHIERIQLLGADSQAAIDRARVMADATILARDLTNEPAGALYPETLAERAREVADVNGLEYEVFDERTLEERGFGGIVGVAQGSDRPPRFIQMRHRPPEARGSVAIIGKGITFDSGGLSLKDAKNMEQMKTDMAGAAAVIGAMSALARLDIGIEVLGLVSAAENLPSGSAIKPGDVITHYGGRTSEVTNTDAEGRLVLADAIAFACERKPDAIVDVATLTGSIVVALGNKASGIFSNDERLGDELAAAARGSGERMWRMPIYDDYRKELDSEVADIKNSGPRQGGAILGALFLKDFVATAIPWAHLDIAGPSRAESDYDEIARGGSGVAARTLIAWLEARAK